MGEGTAPPLFSPCVCLLLEMAFLYIFGDWCVCGVVSVLADVLGCPPMARPLLSRNSALRYGDAPTATLATSMLEGPDKAASTMARHGQTSCSLSSACLSHTVSWSRSPSLRTPQDSLTRGFFVLRTQDFVDEACREGANADGEVLHKL